MMCWVVIKPLCYIMSVLYEVCLIVCVAMICCSMIVIDDWWSVIDWCVTTQGAAPAAAATTKKKAQEEEDLSAPLKVSSGKEQRFRDEKNLKVNSTDVSAVFTTRCICLSVGPGKSGNYVDGRGKIMCIVWVAWLLFIFVNKMKIHIQCML